MIKNQTTLTGAAGEYFVMYRLLRMGYIAALAPKNVPHADIIVTDVEGQMSAVIQVKTRSNKGADGGWSMGEKHEHLKSKKLFYCFVDLKTDDLNPVVYIVPSWIVADVVAMHHKIWLSTPGKGGRAHKDGDMRRFVPDYKKTLGIDNDFTSKHASGWLDVYKENWKILNNA